MGINARIANKKIAEINAIKKLVVRQF